AYALQKHFKRVDTFLFSTQLAEITPMLRSRDLYQALFSLGQVSAGWSGGTKIGESLRDFNAVYGRKLLSRHTLFLILSDGWDTGEPDMLAEQLDAIKRRVRKIIWLNPLLGMAEYQPVTRGMSAALPFIDVFAAAHNLESLLALERHLTRS
ncbi:MAG: VWA domain-containing protein, partial [Terriglobales bacterium]